ncbi:MAG: xanthosine triphosphate pyrophosphatase, partial [Oscillospiraceae bacterium]|nr:xanthosine triphosphate pyrophosphatase [Oscillospiraceae bacterium]
MKILYGTTNPAKLSSMRKWLSGLDIELVSLNDMDGEIPDVPETGDTPLENAELKARAYYKAFGMPVFSADSGLYFDDLPEYSPRVHVRNVNGKHLTDDEMIEYYGGLAAKYGDIKARYRNAICFVLDELHIYTEFSDDISWDPFLITSVPHPKRVEGYPLDSLSKYIENGEYCYDSERPQYEE